MCVCVCAHARVFVCVRVCMHVSVCVSLCVCMNVGMCVSLCVCHLVSFPDVRRTSGNETKCHCVYVCVCVVHVEYWPVVHWLSILSAL